MDDEVDPFVELGLTESEPDVAHALLCHDDWDTKDVVWVGVLQKWMRPSVCRKCGYLTAEDAEPPASLDDVSQAEWNRTDPWPSGMPGNPIASVRDLVRGQMTRTYEETLLRGPVDPLEDFSVDPNPPVFTMTYECRVHPDFLTHLTVEWETHLKEYHPRQWAQRQIDLADMRCPGCDVDPVGYAPHNGKGDCPPK